MDASLSDLTHFFQTSDSHSVQVQPLRPNGYHSQPRASVSFQPGDVLMLRLDTDEVGEESIPVHVVEDAGELISVRNEHSIARYRVCEPDRPLRKREHLIDSGSHFRVSRGCIFRAVLSPKT